MITASGAPPLDAVDQAGDPAGPERFRGSDGGRSGPRRGQQDARVLTTRSS